MTTKRSTTSPAILSKGAPAFLAFLCLLSAASAAANAGDVWRDATLYRDEWGVPHIYASTPFSMAFVFGYAQAEDHAEHMLLAYRMANGRLASVLGEAHADSDAFSLKMGHARLAEAAFPSLDSMTRTICEGFAMGVNAWLVDHAADAPPWADGVQPQDILALWHAFAMSMAPLDLPDIYRRPPAMTSGNAWAMSGQRGSEGAPILVINPHQHHDGLFQWYEAHLVMGEMNVYGTTLRGLPVIIQGHNEHLGWALTPNQPDFADIYREEYQSPERGNPRDPRIRQDDGSEQQALLLHYMAHSVPYHVRTPEGLETRYVPAYIGERGPLFEHPALGLHSWYIGGYNDFGALRQFLEMGAAVNFDHFGAALSMQQIPCFNIIYADRDGNIFYLYNAKAGIRIEQSAGMDGQHASPNYRWNEPLPHGVAAVAWREVFGLQALPHITNPPSGYVQACGNPPWTATMPGALDPSLWPDWLVRDRETYRAMRVRQLLQQGTRSFRDHQSMLFDVVVPAALDLVPALARTIEQRRDAAQAMHPDFWTGVNLLMDWNYIAETVSTGMTFFHLWFTFCRTRAAQHFTVEQDFYAAAIQGVPAAQEIMLRSAEDAAKTLRNEYGTLEKPWGEVHRIRRGSREAPIPGAASGDPIFIASDYVYDRGAWLATYGFGFAMVAQFGPVVESVSLLPFGASQVPRSPHYDDQFDLMLSRQFKRVRFHHDDILRNARRALGKSITLLPAGVTGAVTLHSHGIIHARLTTAVEAPSPLPSGLAPFSLYIQPERTPAGTPLMIEASIYIPESICNDSYFSQLALYRAEPGLPWHLAPFQQQDFRARILYMRDDAPAEWYVVLGPLDAVGAPDSSPDGQVQYHAQHQEPVGLDALLNAHTAQPSITGRGRLFRLDRHDIEDSVADAPPPESPGERSQGSTFRLERHDTTAEDPPASAESSPLTGIPGLHFGPAARQEQERRESRPARIFNVERLDQPTAPPESDTEEVSPAPLESPPPPVSETPPVVTDSEVAVSEPPPIQPRGAGRHERPPLPDVIPQDPYFIFGPEQGPSHDESEPQNGSRVFHLERHN